MTFTVFLEMTVRPDAEDAADIARDVLSQTAARDGIESLEVLVDDADPLKWVVIEKWASVDARNDYVAWRATPEGANRLGDIAAAAPVFRTFEHTLPVV